jgi:hypothetical protein
LPSSSNHPEIQSLIAGGHWQQATMLARRIGIEALAQQKYAVARNTGILLERLQDHRASAHLMSASMRALEPASSLPEWNGSDISGGTLLVISRNMHVGPLLRLGRLLPIAARRARRCIALVPPRMAPLLHRSFPEIDVRVADDTDLGAHSEADVVASYETLVHVVGVADDGKIVALPPLRPDRDQVENFRAKYRAPGPLIGICWHSTNENKDLPTLDDWAAFLSGIPATFVSIQYGDTLADIERLRASSERTIIHDTDVDSLVDLDLFAAQMASLDAVVTISNTGAHMAGALDVPMHVLLDDKNQLIWPFAGRTSDWYSSATLYRKAGRPWPDVFTDVSGDLSRERGR